MIMVVVRDHRSINPPANSPISSHGATPTTASIVTVVSRACRVCTAINGSVIAVSDVPSSPKVPAVHNRAKVVLRSSNGAVP